MHLSRFLPSDFDLNNKIVLIAGRGVYPQILWNAMDVVCPNASIIAFEDETDSAWLSSINSKKLDVINIGKIGKLLKILKNSRTTYVIMAGQIAPKKLFSGLKPDLKALTLLASLRERNASTIFGKIISEIESLGITILDARSFMDDHIASSGVMAGSAIKMPGDIFSNALKTVKQVADLEIGQGIVVSTRGTVIAVEAFEGTDRMIERAGALCPRDMLLLKTSKKMHDFRFDVPCFGQKTLDSMCAANIKWAALESDKTIMLDKNKLLSNAAALGVSIIGY